MRGDRLLKLMLLLQSRGKMTVCQLSKELEVSERTVYRDIEALGIAGIPVVTERGPGGGCYLIEGFTTRLTGLTEEETTALFASAVPSALESLGLGKTLGSALTKLSAALPGRLRDSESRARGKIRLDFGSISDGGILEKLRSAAIDERRLRIVRSFPYGPVEGSRLELTIDPLGLVATHEGWILVFGAGPGVRCLAVTDILEAEVLPIPIEARHGFDLELFWAKERARRSEAGKAFAVKLSIDPAAAIYLRPRFGTLVERLVFESRERDAEGRTIIDLRFSMLEEALLILPGLGSAVEVLDPPLLRLALSSRARECAERNAPLQDQLSVKVSVP